MKKLLVVLILATLVTGGAFAQISLSAGAGVNLGVYSISYSEGDSPDPGIGFGFHGFFDAKYVVAKLGLYIDTREYNNGYVDITQTSTLFSIGLLGKFPIEVGSNFTIFPMLGFEYLVFLESKLEAGGASITYKRGDLDDAADYDMFILQIGVGADFNVSEKIYIRPSIIWGVDLSNTEKVGDVDVFCHKLDVGVAVGFKF